MPRKARKTKFVGLSLTEKDTEILDIYLKEKNYLSRSEAVRHTIQYAYDKEFPGYVYKTTPAGEMKKRKLDEIKSFEEMSDEDYARSLDPLILTAQDGTTKWAIFRQQGNSIKPFLVEGIKDLASNEGFLDFVARHRSLSKERSVEEQINSYVGWPRYLLEDCDILWERPTSVPAPNDQDKDQRDDDSDSGLPSPEENLSVATERPSDSDNEAGAVGGLSPRLEGGPSGHIGNPPAEWPSAPDRSEDGEGQTPPSADSLSEAIGRIRSHGPRSE